MKSIGHSTSRRGSPPRRNALRFWLRDIWGPQWDRERRALLVHHYWSYLRSSPVPARHLPPPDSVAIAAQRAFSDRYRRRIDFVQGHAPTARRVRLSFRPIGKNLRLVATALRHHVDHGWATEIAPDGPPTEVAALAAKGRDWNPWLWSRQGPGDDAAGRGNAADGWRTYFSRPSRDGRTESPVVVPAPRWIGAGSGAFTAGLLERALELAAASHYVFTPSGDLDALLADSRRASGWPAAGVPVLGLHVRRGDAASSEPDATRLSNRLSFPLAQYLEAADTLCATYGIRHIYLATESSVEVERAAALRPQYTFLTINHDRTIFPDIAVKGQYIEELALEHPERARALALSAIVDLHRFTECQAFVGAFNSEFSVLAWLLAVGAQGHLVPHVSLSEPAAGWCWHPYDALLNLHNNCPLELYHW